MSDLNMPGEDDGVLGDEPAAGIDHTDEDDEHVPGRVGGLGNVPPPPD